MSSYFPPFGDDAWARTTPQEAGLSAEGVADAIAHAQAHETPWVTNLSEHLNAGHFEPPPWNEIIGPTRGRGGPSGVIIAGGKIAAEWHALAARHDVQRGQVLHFFVCRHGP
jgi:hypothetical protein